MSWRPRLRLSGPELTREHVVLGPELVVGREPKEGLRLDFPWLSRQQLRLFRSDDGWWVEPMGRNPTLLNDRPLEGPARVEPGDRFRLGPLTIAVTEDDGRIAESDGGLDQLTVELPIGDPVGPRSALGALVELSLGLGQARGEAEVAERVVEFALGELAGRSAAVFRIGGEEGALYAAAGAGEVKVKRRWLADACERGAVLGYALESGGRAASFVGDAPPRAAGAALVAPLGHPSAWAALVVERAHAFRDDEAALATLMARLAGAAGALAMVRQRERRELDRVLLERTELKKDIERRGHYGALVGSSRPIVQLAEKINAVAPSDATAVILGETGSGKELVAREIHARSPRRDRAFLAVNCAALPDALLESELFGHRRGAFTGADRDRKGVFELAEGGTVFLDEVGELSPSAQAKLLRALDAKEIVPLGSSVPRKVDVRVVAATHRDLKREVAEQRFRSDLWFRLSVFPIPVPPLRDRLDDLPALVRYLLERSADARRKRVSVVSPRAMRALAGYAFPGNVRELAHILERAVLLADPESELEPEHLSDEIAGAAEPSPAVGEDEVEADEDAGPPGSLKGAVAAFERALIVKELDRRGWNRTQTAKDLGISVRGFMAKLAKYGIRGPNSAGG